MSKQFIPDDMPERVVDSLEVVEANVEERSRIAFVLGALEHLAHALHEHVTARETREGVTFGLSSGAHVFVLLRCALARHSNHRTHTKREEFPFNGLVDEVRDADANCHFDRGEIALSGDDQNGRVGLRLCCEGTYFERIV